MKAAAGNSISSLVKVVLDVAWYVVAIGVGLALCLLILSSFTKRPGNMELGLPVSFDLDLRAPLVTSASPGIEGVRIKGARGTLNMPVQRGGFLFATIATLIVLLTMVLWVLSQLRAVFRTLRDGRPFVPANVSRLRWVGVGVIL